MNVFEVHRRIIDDYARYIQSFIRIEDDEIRRTVDQELQKGKLWPEPLLQFNPAFQSAGRVADLAASGVLHRDTGDVFTGYSLWQHQLDAIQLGAAGKDFVVTSGTGSGKSLTYIGTIFSHLLANPGSKGVVAVVVYPLNALINSQTDELNRYAANYKQAKHHDLPISYGQYTGQEEEGPRERMRQSPPQILLTNYMMLELLLTRVQERSIRDAIYENLRYHVFDELHTLWFAIRGARREDTAVDVWCFDANERGVVSKRVQDHPLAVTKCYVYRPPHASDRIVRQSGWFTLHPLGADGAFRALEADTRYGPALARLRVPRPAFAELRFSLDRYGAHEATFMADLPGAAAHIDWSHRVLGDEGDKTTQAERAVRERRGRPPARLGNKNRSPDARQ